MSSAQDCLYLQAAQRFHQQLYALDAAGLEFDLGLQSRARNFESVRALQAQFERWAEGNLVGDQGEFLTALSNSQEFSPIYKRALERWVLGERIAALDMITASPIQARAVDRSYAFVALQFLLIFGATFMTLIGVCLYLVPTISAIQSDSFRPPGPGLRSLQVVRAWLPVWAVSVPIVLGALFIFRRRFWSPKKSSDAAFALAETQSLLSKPISLSWVTHVAILLCGVFMMIVAYWIYGTTIELLIDIMRAGTDSV